ncbi:HupE/UreJ family protein [Luteolibacter marinus]|uniref:HupE/UreJ family protein n=1 Tax=Luteolibacter marinus TaxID=2776705 RepID=UPI0031B9E519
MTRKRWLATALQSLAALFLLGVSSAHELRPSYLQVIELEAGTYDVLWKVPARGDNQRLALDPRFEGNTTVTGDPVDAFVDNAHVRRWKMECPDGIAGTRVHIDGLAQTFTDALVRVAYADGTEFVTRLQADNPATVITAAPGPGAVAWTYFVLGVEHILLGIDHLLFVLALLLIIDSRRKLVGTITAFTLAHSITLALASLGYVSLPGPPVEAVIALSIVLVALEILRKRRGDHPATARWPWVVAFGFGLLHGFGFAGALSDIGLPQKSVPLALLLFNVGVEAGQLLFVAAVLLLAAGTKRLPVRLPGWTKLIPPYAIGSLAMFWVIERSWDFTLGHLFSL